MGCTSSKEQVSGGVSAPAAVAETSDLVVKPVEVSREQAQDWNDNLPCRLAFKR